MPFGHDAEQRRRVVVISYVEEWPQRRIEGQAAETKRIQVIPSKEAARQNWHTFEHLQSKGAPHKAR